MEAEGLNNEAAATVRTQPMAVVSPAFCFPCVMDLAIVKKLLALTDGNFTVTDVNDKKMFKVVVDFLTFRERRVLCDGTSDEPLITFQRKHLTMHKRWQAFRGDSTSSEHLIFSAKKSALIQFKTTLDVFLASNTSEHAYDYRVKGNWLEKKCKIYAGKDDSEDNIVAKMHKKHTVTSIAFGKDHFSVTVYPQVDCAFIVALVVILQAINAEQSGGGSDSD